MALMSDKYDGRWFWNLSMRTGGSSFALEMNERPDGSIEMVEDGVARGLLLAGFVALVGGIVFFLGQPLQRTSPLDLTSLSSVIGYGIAMIGVIVGTPFALYRKTAIVDPRRRTLRLERRIFGTRVMFDGPLDAAVLTQRRLMLAFPRRGLIAEYKPCEVAFLDVPGTEASIVLAYEVDTRGFLHHGQEAARRFGMRLEREQVAD
jgi:hypothetical protein